VNTDNTVALFDLGAIGIPDRGTPVADGLRSPGIRALATQMSSPRPGQPDGELIATLESCREALTRFAIWLARDRAVAEDIVQETMLRAWRARKGLREPAAVRAWLFTIARREHARLYDRKRLLLVDIDTFRDGEEAEFLQYDDDPRISDLRRAILALPDDYRVPLVMQTLGGFTTAEIASELNLSLTAVLTRLFRARNRLRELCGTTVPDTDVTADE
jgi:RNA polymerase sigma-70 factor (ECF subfamily)